MRMELWFVGKTKVSFVKEGFEEYFNRTKRYENLKIQIIPESNAKTKTNISLYKKTEAENILRKLNQRDILILLDEKGKQHNSASFASFIQHLKHHFSSTKCILLIGGAYGFSDKIKQRAQHKISLSKLTFPHQLVRLVLIEQLYRAFTILNNESYHH